MKVTAELAVASNLAEAPIMSHPRITIVTPSYNQGQFLEETIQSVLGQCYPNLEYIIMDGGSTDDSVDIIKKYEKHLAYWTSGKDGGQSSAINSGFNRATGVILGWLNSDDMYLPGTLRDVAGRLNTVKSEIILGNCLHINDANNHIYGSNIAEQHEKVNLMIEDYIIQPSTFWTKCAWDTVGPLDENLVYSFDWEWFLRAEQMNVNFVILAKYLSVYRIHEAHKTGTGRNKRQDELACIYEKYAGNHYKDLYIKCCQAGKAVTVSMRWINRLRIRPISGPFLRLIFPKLFGNANPDDIWSIMKMR